MDFQVCFRGGEVRQYEVVKVQIWRMEAVSRAEKNL